MSRFSIKDAEPDWLLRENMIWGAIHLTLDRHACEAAPCSDPSHTLVSLTPLERVCRCRHGFESPQRLTQLDRVGGLVRPAA